MGKYFGWVGGEIDYFQKLRKANKFNDKNRYMYFIKLTEE